LRDGALAFGIELDEAKCEALIAYKDAMLEENKTLNMTAITSDDAFLEMHLLDSLSAARYLSDGDRAIDVGTGAGLPGIAIAIARPAVEMTLLDATERKIEAIGRILKKTGISGITLLLGRAEELSAYPSEFRGAYDVALARALAKMPVLIEYCAGFVAVGGKLVAMKSDKVDSELAGAVNTARVMGFEKPEVGVVTLPSSGAVRQIFVYKKIRETPTIFPRTNKRIISDPLG
jgi:16S rRNA (guanine527-N7)-methyltransferase